MPTLRLLSWNVNGLRAIYKKGFVDWLRRDMPDVLCLQETKVATDQIPAELKSMPGYFSYFGSGERKGRDGVALFSKTEPLSVKYTLGIDGFDDEHRAIVADYGQFLLFNVYFPNGKASPERLEYKLRYKLNQIQRTERLLETLPEEQKPAFKALLKDAGCHRDEIQSELNELYLLLEKYTNTA